MRARGASTESGRTDNVGAIDANAALKAGSAKGVVGKKVMDSGALVSDEIGIGLVKEGLTHPDCKNGYGFDGVPPSATRFALR